jgi:hypothetical protein
VPVHEIVSVYLGCDSHSIIGSYQSALYIFFQNTNMYFKEFLPKSSEPSANEYFDVIVVPIHFLLFTIYLLFSYLFIYCFIFVYYHFFFFSYRALNEYECIFIVF